MTAKQRKFMIWCGVIVVAFYMGRSIIASMSQAAYYRRQQAIRAAQAQKAKQKITVPEVAPAATAPTPAPPTGVAPNANIPGTTMPRAKIAGVWHGRSLLEGRGLCDLRFEIRETAPDKYSGYSGIACFSVSPMMAAKDLRNAKSAMLNRLDPDAAILSGALENGVLHFTSTKNIGQDINGCAVSSLTLTPFGNDRMAAEWQAGDCPGGHMILGKSGK